MKKILLIEDEPINAVRLKRLLLEYDGLLEIDGPLVSVDAVVDWLTIRNDYDLIFADIRILGGEVFDAFREVMPKSFVIFITAYDDYSIQAFANNGISYILKPIDRNRLVAEMNRIDTCLQNIEGYHSQIEHLMNSVSVYRQRFLLYKGEELIPVDVNKILYFYKEGTTAYIYTDDNERYTLSIALNEIQKQLDPKVFFRLNRQYLANVSAIYKISLYFGSKLRVRLRNCSESVLLSKDKSMELRTWIDR